jgi:uncharacterized protein CbrC (UPF0167 family)
LEKISEIRRGKTGAVYEAKFMLPWSFSEGAAAEKHMAQLQHNMWVTNAKTAALSIITGGGKWVRIESWYNASQPEGGWWRWNAVFAFEWPKIT